MSEDLNPIKSDADPLLNEDSPKKRITRRRLSATKKHPTHVVADDRKTSHHPTIAPIAIPAPAQRKEINEFLTNLYQDENGKVPDMQMLTMKKNNTFIKTMVGLLGVGVIVATLLWFGFFLLPSKQGPVDNQVSIAIQGPTTVNLGATSTYAIAYANNSTADLKNVIVNVYYPDGFVFTSSNPASHNAGHNEWTLGTIAAHTRGTILITGLPFGSVNDPKSWRVFLNYTPANFNSELQKAATLTTAITNSPVTLSISGPDTVAVGTPSTYTVVVQTDSGWSLPLQVVPELPTNFVLSSTSPKLNAGGYWPITYGTSSPSNGPLTFSLTGTFTAGTVSSSPLKAFVYLPQPSKQNYLIASAQLTSQLIKNEVSVDVAINGAVKDFDAKPGDMLNMTVRVKNASATEIKNAVVKLALTAPAEGKQSLLKWTEISDQNNGDIFGEQISDTTRKGTITWTSRQIPALTKLKPGDIVTVDIQLPIKTSKEFDLNTITISSSTAVASVSFTDGAKVNQNISTKPITMTLNSDLSFTNDDLIGTANDGKTTHAVNWVINNSFHTLKDVLLTASTFGDISVVINNKGAGDLNFDSNQNKITWSVPEMTNNTDVLNSSFTITINKNNPSQSLLLSKVHVTALDTVTGKTLDLAGDEININQ
jgi:uncharacterized repeat protein (TIGR01451 family)